MTRFLRFIVITLLLTGPIAGCDTYEQDEFEQEYVVEAYLVAGEPLPPLKLSRTAPIEEHYSFEAFAVDDATVTIHLLDDRGEVERSIPYELRKKGVYEPVDTTALVLPLRQYALEIQTAEGEVIRSQTLVPGTFSWAPKNATTVVYQATEQLEAIVTRSEYPGRQNIYVFTLKALDPSQGMTPFYQALVEDDEDFEPEDFVENSSGYVNEANFTENPDGTLTLRLPWVAVAFYGPNLVIANAIDDNLYDFLRSQESSGTTSPGEMYNLIDHIEGGRGVFGSMSRAELEVTILPPGEGAEN